MNRIHLQIILAFWPLQTQRERESMSSDRAVLWVRTGLMLTFQLPETMEMTSAHRPAAETHLWDRGVGWLHHQHGCYDAYRDSKKADLTLQRNFSSSKPKRTQQTDELRGCFRTKWNDLQSNLSQKHDNHSVICCGWVTLGLCLA